MRRRVRVDGAEVVLSPREFALLALLVRNAGRVITHRQLLTGSGARRTPRTCNICASMSAICARSSAPPAPALIRTEAGIGYRLVESEGAA